MQNKNLINVLVGILALVVLLYIVFPSVCNVFAPTTSNLPIFTDSETEAVPENMKELFESDIEGSIPEGAPVSSGANDAQGAGVTEAEADDDVMDDVEEETDVDVNVDVNVDVKSDDKPIPKGPYVDSQTGSLIDGPGFDKGEIDDVYREPSSSIPSNYYFLDDGASGEMSIQHNLCSRSCCSEQWPTPFKKKFDPYVCQNKDKFIPSNIMCNNSLTCSE
jgi:hypothetical protein